MPESHYLLDVNMLIALADLDHVHHQKVVEWFDAPGRDWGICALSESGFLRISTNPKAGKHSIDEANKVLARLTSRPGYRYWPITASWSVLAAPFAERIFGHQQITDAYLLGMAVKENGILVTFDKAIRFLAGPEYANNLLLLD